MSEQAFEPWIGVDLDGTLAEYHGWVDDLTIGKPVDAMVQRVRKWLADGKTVKIFTARVAPWPTAFALTDGRHRPDEIAAAIENWCETHIGCTLDVTCTKDPGMVELWDDRCVQVETNTGKRLYVHKEYTLS